MGGESTRARVWERFYIAPFREIALLFSFTIYRLPPQSQSVRQDRQPGDITRKQRSTARLQIDARPPRDGFSRAVWVQHTQLASDTANLSRPSGVSLNAEQRHLVLEVRALGLCAFKWDWGAQLSAPLGKARHDFFLSG